MSPAISRSRPFQQVDVFTAVAYRGNPVAVVLDGDGLSTDEMQRVANLFQRQPLSVFQSRDRRVFRRQLAERALQERFGFPRFDAPFDVGRLVGDVKRPVVLVRRRVQADGARRAGRHRQQFSPLPLVQRHLHPLERVENVRERRVKLGLEEADHLAGCPVVFNFDPNDFVLTAFQRIQGGAPIGDQATARVVRQLFFKI